MMEIKNICCIGAGYVGGPTMAVIALKCPNININVVDLSKDKIDAWNSNNLDDIPVKEPGLSEIIHKTRGKNLFFSNDIEKNINKSEMIFIAVNTPTKTSGRGKGMAADLKYVVQSAKTIAKASKTDKIIIEKSTLPVRTAEKIKKILSQNNNNCHFEVISNPEFLAEGTAIKDLFKSDRVLIGGDNTKSGQNAVNLLKNLYLNWIPEKKIITTNVWSSELSKLASNAMLAQRISSVNSLSALCQKTSADIDEVSKVIGLDKRIGPAFLKTSVGFGGSCFQKDILNLVYISRSYGLNEVADYWQHVININDYQKNRFSNLIIDKSSDGDTVSVLGWAFKKDTNDSRESASIYVTKNLLEQKMNVKVFDPLIKKNQIIRDLTVLYESLNYTEQKIIERLSKLEVCKNYDEAVYNTKIISILTEWDEFRRYDWNLISKKLPHKLVIVDGRNILTDIQLDNDKIDYYKL